jgi:hypothetical protein
MYIILVCVLLIFCTMGAMEDKTALSESTLEVTNLTTHAAAREAIEHEGIQSAIKKSMIHSTIFYVPKTMLKIMAEKPELKAQIHSKAGTDGMLPIHLAAWKGHANVIPFLIGEYPESISEPDKNGYTPLHYAAGQNHVEVVKYLCKQGASVNAQACEKDTPLLAALWYWYRNSDKKSCIPTFLALLEYKAKLVSLPSSLGIESAPWSREDFKKAVGFLVRNKENISERWLHKAVQENWPEEVACLIKNGVNCNIANINHETPLHMAVMQGRDGMVSTLVAHGADMNILGTDAGLTPLYAAFRLALLSKVPDVKEKFKVVSACLAEKAEIDPKKQVDSEGNTILHAIAGVGGQAIYWEMQSLKEKGLLAGINIRNGKGETPLFICVSEYVAIRAREDVLRLKMDTNKLPGPVQHQRATDFHAGELEKIEWIKKNLFLFMSYAINLGADPHIASALGETPLKLIYKTFSWRETFWSMAGREYYPKRWETVLDLIEKKGEDESDND